VNCLGEAECEAEISLSGEGGGCRDDMYLPPLWREKRRLTWRDEDNRRKPFVGFNEPELELNVGLQPRYADVSLHGEHAGENGLELWNTPPESISLNDEQATPRSLWAPFRFYESSYDAVLITSNGYVAFDLDEHTLQSNATGQSHFSPARGPAFSAALTDFAVSNVFFTHVMELVDNETHVPHADVITYRGARIAFDESDTPNQCAPPTNTVQLTFLHETGEIQVAFGELSPLLDAIVGPSSGASDQDTTLTSLSDLVTQIPPSVNPCDSPS